MAYQPLSKLISQPPTIKELHITTDNWPKERSRFGNMVRDPQDPNFNWWFWCGISNKQGLLDLVNDYKQASGSLLHFKDMKEEKLKTWFKDKIKNKVHKQIMINSIITINVDTPRNARNFKDIFKSEEVISRILFTIFSQRYILMEGYSQTDMFTLQLVTLIISHINSKQLDIYNTKLNSSILKETLVYSILTKLLDLKISSLYIFPSTIRIDNKTDVDIVKEKNKNFHLHDFFQFLFATMFLKFLEDKELKTDLLSHPQKKQIFSGMCEAFRHMLWSPRHPFLVIEKSDPFEKQSNKKTKTNKNTSYEKNILTIIGKTLVDNDLITYMIYMIAYFCQYLKKTHVDNFNSPDGSQKHPMEDIMFYAHPVSKKLINTFWTKSIPKTKVAEIRNFLLKKLKRLDGSSYTKLEEIIKLAKSKQTTKIYDDHSPVLFKFPNKLLKPSASKKRGGRFKKTIKQRRHKRRKTLKR